MRAPGDNKKIQAGDDEIRPFTGSLSGARSEDTTSWLLIPVRSQEQLTQCATLELARGGSAPLRSP